MASVLGRATARFADVLRDHAPLLRKLQWGIVAAYAFLLIVPVFLPLPDNAASVFDNLTVLAQFAFWGVWWPFVLVSMPLLGRRSLRTSASRSGWIDRPNSLPRYGAMVLGSAPRSKSSGVSGKLAALTAYCMAR